MMRTPTQSFLSLLERLEGYAAMLAYVSVATLLIGDVLAREVIGVPVLGSQSIAVMAAIVAGFLGLSLATAKGIHLRPEVFDHVLPARFDPLLARGSDIVAAAFYGAMTVFAVRFVMESQAAGDRAAVLYFPLWPVQLVMPYAFLSCAIRHAAYAVNPRLKVAPKSAD
ncbi:TRAP transporter small permease [Thalassovita sp.]|uniref:TRAP transporter small permease n=1 Tax=Thalassovita sp. TaxID=1979401 RepID=UPI0029DE685F|nr:TRAP transporter small permease [Thalassovita sp.]